MPDAIARLTASSLDGEGDQIVVRYRDGAWSRSQLRSAAAALEAALSETGIPDRAAIGVYLRNRPACVAALATALRYRRPLVVLSPLLPDATVGDDVRAMELPAVLATEEDWDRAPVRAAVSACGAAHAVLSDDPDRLILKADRGAGAPAAGGPGPEIAVLMLTSGTTGPPKRVSITRRALHATLENAQAHFVGKVGSGAPVRGRGVTIAPLPPVNISGLWALISVLIGGGSVVLQDRFEPHEWARAVERYGPRSASLPPTALRMVMEGEIPPSALQSLRAIWAGAAPLDPALAEAFEARYGIAVLPAYGATEFTGGIAGWSLQDWRKWKDAKRGSVGRAFAGVEIEIRDQATGEPLPAGEVGILTIRTAQAAGVGGEEWVATTDLGRLDDDGFLWIEGRADDVIIRGGFKVSPIEVERVLCSHPAVADAAVIGVPNERLGAVPVAVVVSRDEAPSQQEIVDFVKGRLQAYKAPVRVVFVSAIPKTTSLKPDRRRLLELAAP
jgi:long-chain acyl-CoA synthetase